MVPTPKKSASTPKKSASTPKSTPKKSGSTPKSIRTPRSSKKLEKSLDHLELAEETSPLYSVSFLSDVDSDLIQDVERIAHYKPTLSDIPEEDSEAHTVINHFWNCWEWKLVSSICCRQIILRSKHIFRWA